MIPSPCISVCKIEEETGCCAGCRRTREEIAGWPGFDDREKLLVLERLKKRAAEPR